MIFSVPKYDSWPSLGGQVCDFIESYLVHGPGDLRGEPVRLDPEKRALIWRMYEVFPQGHEKEGRRRFSRVGISVRKGYAKTELAAMIAAVELHPLGPVRCDGFDAQGQPVGVGVKDPYIPLVAYTEEQSDELAYGALKVILENSPIAEDFDIGIERIMRIAGDGKAVSLSSSPNARDGARTTFQVCDETHRWEAERLIKAHRTMLANMPKRYIAQPWMLEVTTAPEPGNGSVAESTYEYARYVESGQVKDPTLFFFHRQASFKHDLNDPKQLKEAIKEASGPSAAWSDIDGIASQWQDPQANKFYLQRVWLNQLVQDSASAFDLSKFIECGDPDYVLPDNAAIVLGFDGSKWNDATALVATEIATGYQFVLALWENIKNSKDFEVPVNEVMEAIDAAFENYQVKRMYCDPPYWETVVSHFMGKYGKEIVFEWWTNRLKAMAYAIKSYATAITSLDVKHSGDKNLIRHIGNAVRKDINYLDDDGTSLFVIRKDGGKSPRKIDIAMAAILSWECRNDYIAANGIPKNRRSVYEDRGLVIA